MTTSELSMARSPSYTTNAPAWHVLRLIQPMQHARLGLAVARIRHRICCIAVPLQAPPVFSGTQIPQPTPQGSSYKRVSFAAQHPRVRAQGSCFVPSEGLGTEHSDNPESDMRGSPAFRIQGSGTVSKDGNRHGSLARIHNILSMHSKCCVLTKVFQHV